MTHPPLKVLIMGGTNFIGRHVVQRLKAEGGYDITLFNRGRTNPGIHSGIREIYGDRNTRDVELLFGKPWDHVIDLSCYHPHSLGALLEGLPPTIRRYVFISTCSVYDNDLCMEVGRDESAPTLSCTPDQEIDEGPATYGHRKAACERLMMGSGREFRILRPALVYGEFDPTDRLYFWLYHVYKGNSLLFPGKGSRPFSMTYVKDLSNAIVLSLFEGTSSKVVNAISTPSASIAAVVETATNLLGSVDSILHLDPMVLAEKGVRQWIDLPLWLESDHFTYSNERMIELLGSGTTPLGPGIANTVKHYASLNWPTPTFGMTDERRTELLGLARTLP